MSLCPCSVGGDSWTARRSNQSILKEINHEYSLEGLMLKLKLQYFGHLMQRADLLEKNPDAGKDWRHEAKEVAEDEMVGWHQWFNVLGFEQTLGDGEEQGSLVCCSLWGCKELDGHSLVTEQQQDQQHRYLHPQTKSSNCEESNTYRLVHNTMVPIHCLKIKIQNNCSNFVWKFTLFI